MSTAIEDSVTKAYQQQAYDAVRDEYRQYFDALDKHPRLLVGTSVPAIGKEGMETLRDSTDAKEWQDAVKSILVQEIKERAQVKIDESSSYLDTLHSSIDLFKNNPDLIPGTPGFDAVLADRFAGMLAPYEVRVDGKLHGYSIPVQPIIDSLRGQLTAERSTSSAPPASGAAAGAPGEARPTEPVEPPQAAIQSKAGNSNEKEDFSTLFGTIGLPNLQI
jgi:hypothetical protein